MKSHDFSMQWLMTHAVHGSQGYNLPLELYSDSEPDMKMCSKTIAMHEQESDILNYVCDSLNGLKGFSWSMPSVVSLDFGQIQLSYN